jgi:phage shock protein A
MSGFGDFPVTAFRRLARALRVRIADYLDLAPTPEGDEAIATAIATLQEKLGAVLAARRRLEAERATFVAAPVDAAARAEQAIALGRDDLARAAVRQRAALDQRSAELERDLDALGAEAARIEAMIEDSGRLGARALRVQLDELDRLLAAANGIKER